MNKNRNSMGNALFSDRPADYQPVRMQLAPGENPPGGGIYMYPRNINEARLPLADVAFLATQRMQLAPHTPRAERRAIMHIPQAARPSSPDAPRANAGRNIELAALEAVQATQAALTDQAAQTAQAVRAALADQVAQAIQTAQNQAAQARAEQAVQAAEAAGVEMAEKVSQAIQDTLADKIALAEKAEQSRQTAEAAQAPPVLQAIPAVQDARPAAGASNAPVTCHFCTVAGNSYLFKVLTLYRSLEAVSNDFMLYVCCIDNDTLAALDRLHLSRCVPVSVDALNDSELSSIRSQRSASEFCWTLKSHFLLYLLTEKQLPDAVYLDSDVAFFSNPKRLYDDWGQASVYLCRQRDLDWVEQKYGQYQAGVIGFRNDEQGLAAVRWWRDKCRAWCSASADTGLYGDQKYLDEIPRLFSSVKVSTHRGIDAAPWNTVYNNYYPISVSGNGITIDGDPLVAYHFACLDVIDEQHFDLWNLSNITIGQTIRNAIYNPYLARLRDSIVAVRTQAGGNPSQFFSQKPYGNARTPYIFSESNLSLSNWDGVYAFCTIASKQYAARTLALYGSLQRHAGDFHIWICCMDDMAYSILSASRLENATLIRVSEVETPAVKQTQASKKLYEYCWTLKPLLCQYVFERYNISRLLYCDSDIYFFSSPQTIHEAWKRYETFLNLQRGTADLEARHGMYQAGLIGFTKAPESLKTLNWWAQQCTQWCYDDHSDSSRWGDQKYLTQIPNLFTSIKVNNQYGLLAAPWNIVMNNTASLPVHTDGGNVWIGDEALTCYHFGSINVLSENEYDLWKHEPLYFDPAIIESIYKPYLRQLRDINREIRARGFDTSSLFESGGAVQNYFSLEGMG